MNQIAWTEARVFSLLRNKFPKEAFTLIPQVPNGTGFTITSTADAMAVSLWPSRGIYLAGVEIKVRRSDWLKELKSPEKSCPMQGYCKYWYVAAPEGVVDSVEVPDTWGWLECKANTVKTRKHAPELEPVALDTIVVAAILRNAMKQYEGMVLKSEVEAVVSERVNQRIEGAMSSIQKTYDILKAQVTTFEEASGVLIDHQWSHGRIGEAVMMVMNYKHLRLREELVAMKRNVLRVVNEIDRALATEAKAVTE